MEKTTTPKTDYTPAAWADVGWQPKEIKAPGVLPMKLSDAIRRGHTMVLENSGAFLNVNGACAIGAAWVGLGGTEESFMQKCRTKNGIFRHEMFAKEVGISPSVSLAISLKHSRGTPRLEIADWLESQGY